MTTDGGKTWREAFLGELVSAVVAISDQHLVAYVSQQVSDELASPALTWQYVSRDGGRHWCYSTNLGGF